MSRLEDQRDIFVREIGEFQVPATRQKIPKAADKNFKFRRELGKLLVATAMETDEISGRE